MRFTLSAVAGLAGLLLLACAIFGQPELYLRAARRQWIALVEPTAAEVAPPTAPVPDQEPDDLAQQVAQLQQQVIQLRDQLASAPQVATGQARQPSPSMQPAPTPSPVNPPAASQTPQQFVYPQQQPNPPSTDPRPTEHSQTYGVGDRRDPPKQPPRQRSEAVVARVEPDDMQTVLARLRQRPAPPPDNALQTTDIPAPAEVVQRPPSPLPSPVRQRLALARAALLSGRVDEARRLLQEVQLQLVFRPVDTGDDAAPAAAQGASDVARALGALGGNDTQQSQHYIERAINEVAGARRPAIESSVAMQPGGYAPAYPPR